MNVLLCNLIFLLVLALGTERLLAQDRMIVDVYAYHLKPPYITSIEKETGLYYDFSRYLNSKQKKYDFHTVFVPRNRIESYISKKQLNGILIGVNPIWFKDKKREKFLWSSPIFYDQDEIISSINSPFEYLSPDSLIGKRIGGVLGFYYHGIDELIDTGKVERVNAKSEKSVMKLIIINRVDVGIVSRSTAHYLMIKEGWEGLFHMSLIPHDKFTRHILVPHAQKAVFDVIAPVIREAEKDSDWERILKKYAK